MHIPPRAHAVTALYANTPQCLWAKAFVTARSSIAKPKNASSTAKASAARNRSISAAKTVAAATKRAVVRSKNNKTSVSRKRLTSKIVSLFSLKILFSF